MQNHYEVLGLSMHATQEAIRRRYRELVRQYHPDVNPSPQAKERFLRIQEAYQVLSDPERRRHYDALLRLQMGEPPSARYSQPRTQPPRSTQSAQASQPKPSPSQDELRRAILQAERAFLQGRLQDALYWAKQATRLAPRHPKGHEIIGDVYRTQGHYDAALNAYTYAIQLDPNNDDLQRKLDSVLARTQARVSVAAVARATRCARAEVAARVETLRGAVAGLGRGAVFADAGVHHPRRAADAGLESEPAGVSGVGWAS
jgi:curved DNA-binding protein CbpA